MRQILYGSARTTAATGIGRWGTNYTSGKDVYTLGLFGTPSTTTPWLVQFGGYHLGLNVLIAGSQLHYRSRPAQPVSSRVSLVGGGSLVLLSVF